MIRRGSKVTWLSRYKDGHWFKGRVRRIIGDLAIVDDGTGLTPRVVKLEYLHEVVK